MPKNWEWQVNCELCGFKRGWMKHHWVAAVRAFIHTVFKHPCGYVTISAREKGKTSAFTVCSQTDGTCQKERT